jgi:uncharacterized membrane protein YwaF
MDSFGGDGGCFAPWTTAYRQLVGLSRLGILHHMISHSFAPNVCMPICVVGFKISCQNNSYECFVLVAMIAISMYLINESLFGIGTGGRGSRSRPRCLCEAISP